MMLIETYEDPENWSRKLNSSALNVARQFLKDNNITATADNKPLKDLIDGLPDFDSVDAVQAH